MAAKLAPRRGRAAPGPLARLGRAGPAPANGRLPLLGVRDGRTARARRAPLLWGGGGGVVVVVLVARGRGARRAAETAGAALAEVRAAAAARERRLAEATHDLRTLATAAKGQAQLLRRRALRAGGPGANELAAGLGRIDAAVTRMAALADGLLAPPRAVRPADGRDPGAA
jgi:signal transduction histidine kinase